MGIKRKSGLIFGVAVVAISLVMPAANITAQSTTTNAPTERPPLNLTVSPLPLKLVSKPGQTITADLRVKNNNTVPETLQISLLKFGAQGEDGDPELLDREPGDSYFDWVSFSEPKFVAEGNVWKSVTMSIKNPPSAAHGYYYAVVFSRASPDKATAKGSGVQGGVATLVLLDVEAPGSKKLVKVMDVTATKKVYEFLPVEFNVRLRNEGNVHIAPVGNIFIKKDGKPVGMLSFNKQQGYILPGTNRSFVSEWKQGFPVYESKIQGTNDQTKLSWNFSEVENLRFGRYSAEFLAVYDDGRRDVPLEATVYFWVIPWRILGVAGIMAALIIAGIWGVARSIWRKMHVKPPSTPIDTAEHEPRTITTAPATKEPNTAKAPETTQQPFTTKAPAATNKTPVIVKPKNIGPYKVANIDQPVRRKAQKSYMSQDIRKAPGVPPLPAKPARKIYKHNPNKDNDD